MKSVDPPGRLKAALTLRCPKCRRGNLYEGWLQVGERCGVCGLVFLREPGYFVGALYIAYALGIASTAPTLVVGLLFGLDISTVLYLMLGQMVLLGPLILRYSRSLWIHFDHAFDDAG